MIQDTIDDEGAVSDRALIQSKLNKECENKIRMESEWFGDTDNDKLDAVFFELFDHRIVGVQNAGYTMSDGHEDIGEVLNGRPKGTFKGYCFYHGQDVEGAIDGRGLYLAFGDLKNTDAGKLSVGKLICDLLRSHELNVEWDNDPNSRILIPVFNWQRRSRSFNYNKVTIPAENSSYLEALNEDLPIYSAFYTDYANGISNERKDDLMCTKPVVLRLMEYFLRYPNNFMGIVDKDKNVLQFMVNDDGSVYLDIPKTDKNGSYALKCTLDECMVVVQQMNDIISHKSIPGVQFRNWS